jgi:outer membrane protein
MDGLVSFSLDATYRKQFGNNPLDRSLLQLNASIPLFDGFQTRENTRIREFVVQSQSALLLQAERDARAEIESAYVEYLQNTKRQRAAQAAFEAADENFRAAQDGRRLGAGTLLDILTAQLSLVTAEVNRTQATYDLLISEIRLKVVTGTPIPGEES